MDNSYMYVNFSEMEWRQPRENVYRKDAEVYNGIKMNMVHFEPGHAPWLHSHEAEQNIFVIDGSCEITVAGIRYSLSKGCMISVPSWAEHEVVAKDEPATVISVFSPVTGADKPESLLPSTEPYVFDFNEYKWEQLRDKVRRKVFQGSEYFTFAYAELEPGHEPAPHNHEDIQIVFCVDKKTTYYVENNPLNLCKHVVIATAPWVVHNSHNTFDEPVTDLEIFWPKRTNFLESRK